MNYADNLRLLWYFVLEVTSPALVALLLVLFWLKIRES